jgi:tricorn protease
MTLTTIATGHGFVPDQEVDNEPFDTASGGDAQLDAAIRYLQQRIVEVPVTVPEPPPYPTKAFRYAAPEE